MPNPFVTDAEKSHLLGVQGNLWTEYVETPQRAEYMIWPRALAIAELGLNGLDAPRDAEAFHKKALKAVEWLHAHGYNPLDLANAKGDHSLPECFNGKSKDIASVTYNHKYSDSYKGNGDMTLFDNKAGSYDFGDGWLGFIGKEGMDVVIDLGKSQKINSINADFLQIVGPQIYFPDSFIIEVSTNGTDYKPLHALNNMADYKAKDGGKPYSWNGKCKVRYVHIKALPGEKQGWIFCDEINIK